MKKERQQDLQKQLTQDNAGGEMMEPEIRQSSSISTEISQPYVNESSAESISAPENYEFVKQTFGRMSQRIHYYTPRNFTLTSLRRIQFGSLLPSHIPKLLWGNNYSEEVELPAVEEMIPLSKAEVKEDSDATTNINKLLAIPKFHTDAKERMRRISEPQKATALLEMQQIKSHIRDLQKAYRNRIKNLEQMELLVSMMIVGKEYIELFVAKLKRLSQEDIGLVFPEISGGRIEDEAMYYERLANAYRICIGDEAANSIDLLEEQISSQFETHFTDGLKSFEQNNFDDAKGVLEILKKNPRRLRVQALDLLMRISNVQNVSAEEKLVWIADEMNRLCIDLAEELGIQPEAAKLHAINEILIITLGEASQGSNINFLPAFIVQIQRIVTALNSDKLMNGDPHLCIWLTLLLSNIKELTAIDLFGKFLPAPKEEKIQQIDKDSVSRHIEIAENDYQEKHKRTDLPKSEQTRYKNVATLQETEGFKRDCESLLENFLATQLRNPWKQVNVLIGDFTKHKSKYAPFLMSGGISVEDGANLEMDILEATLIAGKERLPSFLEKVVNLDLSKVFYPSPTTGSPKIAFEFTKWVGPIKALAGVTIDA